MSSLDVVRPYFDAWNRHDAAGVVSTLAPGGTYADPATGGPLGGDALAGYVNGLFSAFPDVAFEIASEGLVGPDLVAAQWIMRGTNTGSMNGLPPTHRRIEVPGADFIRVSGDRIQSVQGYFDSRAVPEQLGLQVVVQPREVGPFTFGVARRAWGGSTARPGAVSITALQARSHEEVEQVSQYGRAISMEMLAMKGFIGFVGIDVGGRMLTVTAWEDAEAPRQMMRHGLHTEAVRKFKGPEIASSGYTSVFVPDRFNTMWVRCTSCQKMASHGAGNGVCSCGATLPDPMPYW